MNGTAGWKSATIALAALCVPWLSVARTALAQSEAAEKPAPATPAPAPETPAAPAAAAAKQEPARIDQVSPLPRHAHCAVVVGTKIYVLGGINNDDNRDFLARVDCLETKTGEWTTVAPMPTPRAFAAATVCGDKIYVLGGMSKADFEAQKYSAVVEMYDPASNSWAAKKPLSAPRSRLAAASFEGKVYAIGGMGGWDDKPVDLDAVDEYEPRSDSWKVLPPLRTPRHGLCATVAAGRIWAVGGYTIKRRDGAVPTTAVESMVPRWNTWRPEPSMNTPRGWFGLTAVNDNLWALGTGGGEGKGPEKLSRGAKAWKSIDKAPDMPGRRFATVAIGTMIYVLGGEETGPEFVRKFDCSKDAWESK